MHREPFFTNKYMSSQAWVQRVSVRLDMWMKVMSSRLLRRVRVFSLLYLIVKRNILRQNARLAGRNAQTL